jgi:hypothetical protein
MHQICVVPSTEKVLKLLATVIKTIGWICMYCCSSLPEQNHSQLNQESLSPRVAQVRQGDQFEESLRGVQLKRKFMLVILAAGLAATCLAFTASSNSKGSSANSETGPVDFNRDIRPILSDTCFSCHGPDDKQRMAGLRLDTKEGAFAKSGIIVPNDSAGSRLIQRIAAQDPTRRMPPPYSGHSLTEKQINLLRRWVDEGAKWETHWAYLAPKRPSLPKLNNTEWPRNPIDHFILARLEKEGLKPQPEADRATLLRRVSYDLTGLPPTPEEIESFLSDKSPDAYEKQVDRLLHSKHYGERMAMQWLDLARYADTHGYHIDSHRDMWPWRDWVIKAFNNNMPFDQFTIEQLAGDLLPNATIDQKIASGFNRNHMINFEGGAIPEEYQVEYVVDRVEATTNTWMGMTMGCARCHSHKYDPITHKEFYQFFAFFNSVAEEGLDGREGNARPFLTLPTEEQKARLDALGIAIKAKEEALAEEKVTPAQQDWEKTFTGKVATLRDGLTNHYELDGSFSDISGHYQHGRTIRGEPGFESGPVGRAAAFDGETQVSFGNVGGFDSTDQFSLAAWLNPSSNLPMSALQKIEDPQTRRGYELLFDDIALIGIQRFAARLTIRLTARGPESAIHIRTVNRLAQGEYHHITFTYDGTGRAAGLKLYVNGKLADVEIRQDNLSGSIKTAADFQIGNKETGIPYRRSVDDMRFYNRILTPAEIEHLAIHYPVQAALSGVFGKRTKAEAARVRDYFLTYAAPLSLREAYADLKKLRKQRDELNRSIATVMVMSEMEKPRDTFVLARGDYRNKTEKVTAGVPAVLLSLPEDAPLNRLTLAKWLVDPAHPLTARVAVNRYWQMFFGNGIVKTLEDFGSQGEPPVHPELLDWLATEFMRSGWDIRAMQRLIATSATYRQSSKATPELIEKDPENRLLARGPRFRLSAEVIRDGALAASGLLNSEMGGPGVFPYQSRGLWEEMAFGEGFSAQAYKQSAGKDLYRRSIYTFWKRTVPPASLATFDAPDREKCTARRALTNTPLQALVLMNDPTYVEAARALAERMMTQGGKDSNGRIAYAFRLATARKPSMEEMKLLRGLFVKQLAHYRRDRKSALDLLSVGEAKWNTNLDSAELAAWATVASAILNLDETITKQ